MQNNQREESFPEMIMDRISLLLVIAGAINWGCIGLFGFNLVGWICGGEGSVLSRIIYTAVALGGLWCISLLFRDRDYGYEHSEG